MGQKLSQKLPVDGFKWIEEDDVSKFDVKIIMKIVIKDILLK